eukprot:scaffold313721_cov30-Tisochrysis_lutea.AAC.4
MRYPQAAYVYDEWCHPHRLAGERHHHRVESSSPGDPQMAVGKLRKCPCALLNLSMGLQLKESSMPVTPSQNH